MGMGGTGKTMDNPYWNDRDLSKLALEMERESEKQLRDQMRGNTRCTQRGIALLTGTRRRESQRDVRKTMLKSRAGRVPYA